MTNLLFSYGGVNDSGGMRGGQISNKLTNSYQELILNNQNLNTGNKIIVILKEDACEIKLLQHLKSKGNILVLDVIDWLDVNKYNPSTNVDAPNFYPELLKEYYDGYIVNSIKMKDWWYENMDSNTNKPIFVIPHHWDERFAQLPIASYPEQPYFYYLGYRGHENQNCLHVGELLRSNLLYDDRQGTRYFLDRPTDGCQISIRREGSWEYCFKPATKLSIAAAMDSIMITTYDWSVQDILDENYPYLLKSTDYSDVEKMFKKVKDTYQKEEWHIAKQMLQQVKEVTSLDNIIQLYKQLNNHFTDDQS